MVSNHTPLSFSNVYLIQCSWNSQYWDLSYLCIFVGQPPHIRNWIPLTLLDEVLVETNLLGHVHVMVHLVETNLIRSLAWLKTNISCKVQEDWKTPTHISCKFWEDWKTPTRISCKFRGYWKTPKAFLVSFVGDWKTPTYISCKFWGIERHPPTFVAR